MGYNFKAIQSAYPDKKLLIQEGIGVFDMDVSTTVPMEIDEDLVNETAKTTDIEAENAYNKEMRRRAYVREADPMYFKVQRGEITQADYDSKVAEIRTKYPYI